MLIAIPSKGRPYKSKSKELLKSAVLFVPESEVEFYKKVYSDIVAVPNGVKGITATRNWILKNIDDKHVVFVDDDLKKAGYWVDKEPKGRKFIELNDEKVWLDSFQRLFELTESMDYRIWGLKTEGSKISQHDEKPFVFKTYITASCMGIVNDGSYYFDERYKVKEDYEIGLRHIKEKGGVVGARYISWENHHWDKEGGCGEYRDDRMERECINLLIKEYPKYVKRVSRKNSEYTIQLNF